MLPDGIQASVKENDNNDEGKFHTTEQYSKPEQEGENEEEDNVKKCLDRRSQ